MMSPSYIGLDATVKQFLERLWLNKFNCHPFYFTDINRKELDQNKIIKIFNQTKAWDPEWHEGMVIANIDIFQMPL
jgi:hypothetical protein